jgi:cytochrome P450/glycosyltransferase involved in cell wall biosynthesis
MMNPDLWVVIPAYNEAASIGATLAALAAQTDLDFALVVADNCSADGTAQVVSHFSASAPFRVEIVTEPVPGAGAATDAGFRFAIDRGATMLARTDADCLPDPTWVATARTAMLRGVEMACGRSVPRRDEDPSFAERHLLPAAIRLAAGYGRYRRVHRASCYLTPYVLCQGHNIAITADLYLRCGDTATRLAIGTPQEVALVNRARMHSDRVVRVESMVVEHSLRRVRAWGARRTVGWYWGRRYDRRAYGRARRRDRRVYWRAHPALFVLLAAGRRAPVLRLGRTLLISGTGPFVAALTRLPLDRAAAGTTGGTARALGTDRLLMDQDGPMHRAGRRSVASGLSSAGVGKLRPVWLAVLQRRLAPLASGGDIDVVDLTAELAGATACALLAVDADPRLLAQAARDVAAAAARAEAPGLRRRGGARATVRETASFTRMLQADRAKSGPADRPAEDSPAEIGLAAMLAIAAVNTTVAGIPRAAAWCADAQLWTLAQDDKTRPALVDELLRLIAPTPLLPRVAAGPGMIDGHKVRAGDRLVLIARHAAGAHRRDPVADPIARQLVFGVGPHACPGAKLARAQLDDVLRSLAPYRPVVVRARADRRAALPSWAVLTMRPTSAPS